MAGAIVGRWQFPSSSSNATYGTLAYADGTFSCNCRGWTVKKEGQERSCKHTRDVAERLRKEAKERGRATLASRAESAAMKVLDKAFRGPSGEAPGPVVARDPLLSSFARALDRRAAQRAATATPQSISDALDRGEAKIRGFQEELAASQALAEQEATKKRKEKIAKTPQKQAQLEAGKTNGVTLAGLKEEKVADASRLAAAVARSVSVTPELAKQVLNNSLRAQGYLKDEKPAGAVKPGQVVQGRGARISFGGVDITADLNEGVVGTKAQYAILDELGLPDGLPSVTIEKRPKPQPEAPVIKRRRAINLDDV